MALVKALAAKAARGPVEPFEYDSGPLGAEQVEVAVESCGICHSDLSVLDNEWGISSYPFVPGHEVVGKVTALGTAAKRLKVGDRVGIGWYSGSCMSCYQCMTGNHNLCPTVEATMLGRHGGWATSVRSHWAWAIPLPAGVDAASAGPLMCGGITVFNPITQFGVKPTDRVGVIGIGGLGHMALQFLNKWGCEVVAFTSSESKSAEAKQLGAHRTVNSRDSGQMKALSGSLNFILVTANADLDWAAIIDTLAPKGKLHVVGVTPNPVPFVAFPMIVGQKAISGSPVGSPATAADMLEFSARHGIRPVTEVYPMSRANEALEHLRAGKARYRIVLQNDLK